MRSRTQGMWWGPALEAPDPAALARFYSDLIGWPVVYEEPGTTVLATSREAAVNVVFQQATDYQPPVWPPEDGQQRPMMHFDFQVGDLDEAVDEAVALGATLAPTSRRTTCGSCSTRPATRSASASTTTEGPAARPPPPACAARERLQRGCNVTPA